MNAIEKERENILWWEMVLLVACCSVSKTVLSMLCRNLKSCELQLENFGGIKKSRELVERRGTQKSLPVCRFLCHFPSEEGTQLWVGIANNGGEDCGRPIERGSTRNTDSYWAELQWHNRPSVRLDVLPECFWGGPRKINSSCLACYVTNSRFMSGWVLEDLGTWSTPALCDSLFLVLRTGLYDRKFHLDCRYSFLAHQFLLGESSGQMRQRTRPPNILVLTQKIASNSPFSYVWTLGNGRGR